MEECTQVLDIQLHPYKGYLTPNCISCDILAAEATESYGMSWQGLCQRCSTHKPTSIIINLVCCIFCNMVLTYCLQEQSCRQIYMLTLRQLKISQFSRMRQPLNLLGAYAKILMNYINLQCLLLFLSPKFMHMGIGIGGGIHSIVWFEDCYLTKISSMNVTLMRIPATLILLIILFIIQTLISMVLNLKGGIQFHGRLSNQIYQQYWFLIIGAPTISLVFLPYMMCDTYLKTNYGGSQLEPKDNCSNNQFTAFRWGLAFIFLLFTWLFLPYRTFSKLFQKRFQLDTSVKIIKDQGGYFLEYTDTYYFWDGVKYMIKILLIVFLVTLIQYQLISFSITMIILFFYIVLVSIFKPYKNIQMMQYEISLQLATLIGFFLLLFMLQYSNSYFNKVGTICLFIIQLTLTSIILLMLLSNFCISQINQLSLFAILFGQPYHPLPKDCDQLKVKKAWKQIRNIVQLNILMKQKKMNWNIEQTTQRDIENFHYHEQNERFITSQLLRKRLGIHLIRNIELKRPFENYFKIRSSQKASNQIVDHDLSFTSSKIYVFFQSYYIKIIAYCRQHTCQCYKVEFKIKKVYFFVSQQKEDFSEYKIYRKLSLKNDLNLNDKETYLISTEEQEWLSYIFDRGTLLKNEQLQINFISKVKILPVKDMIDHYIGNVKDVDLINQQLEKDFQDKNFKPICIEYKLDIQNSSHEKLLHLKIYVKDTEEKTKASLIDEISEINRGENIQIEFSLRVNQTNIQSFVYLKGQFYIENQKYKFRVILCKSTIKLCEIQRAENINQQFKSKRKYKQIVHSKIFKVDTRRISHFKDYHPNIFVKEVQIDSYDLQFVWKYYLPLKFFEEDENQFYYQILANSTENDATLCVFQIRNNKMETEFQNSSKKKQQAGDSTLIQKGIVQILYSYLVQY